MESHDKTVMVKIPEVRRGAGPFGVVAKGLEVPWKKLEKVMIDTGWGPQSIAFSCLRKVAEFNGLW